MKFSKNWELLRTIIIDIYLVIVLNDVLVCKVSALSVTDICEFTAGQQIYCSCDNQGVDEARQVTCFIIETNGLNRSSPVWNGFKLQKNITSLMFTTRFDKRLTFLPVTALRNIADSLEVFAISEMKLNYLDTHSIKNLSKLIKINLESNEIRGLSESVFSHLPALKILSLSSNSIEVLKAKTLIHLPRLEEIYLDRNRLTTIEDNAFSGLKSVRELDLRLNEINVITSATFNGLTGLKRLDLSRNRLKTIPQNAWIGAPLLRELDLNKNQIDTIDENAFQNMSHLMSIQLNENEITYLSTQTFKGCPNLVFIDLSNNLLTTIENELVNDLVHLHQDQFVIYLRDNRLECDCRLLWLSDPSLKLGQLFRRELRHIKCVFKKEMQMSDYKVGEDIKVIMFGRNDSARSECQFQTNAEIEDFFDEDNENSYENSVEETDIKNDNKNNTTISSTNESKIASTVETKTPLNVLKTEITSETQEVKTQSTQSNESDVEVFSEAQEVETNLNEINVRQNTITERSQVEASHDRSGGQTDGQTDGSLCRHNTNTKILIPFIFILYVFFRYKFI